MPNFCSIHFLNQKSYCCSVQIYCEIGPSPKMVNTMIWFMESVKYCMNLLDGFILDGFCSRPSQDHLPDVEEISSKDRFHLHYSLTILFIAFNYWLITLLSIKSNFLKITSWTRDQKRRRKICWHNEFSSLILTLFSMANERPLHKEFPVNSNLLRRRLGSTTNSLENPWRNRSCIQPFSECLLLNGQTKQ